MRVCRGYIGRMAKDYILPLRELYASAANAKLQGSIV